MALFRDRLRPSQKRQRVSSKKLWCSSHVTSFFLLVMRQDNTANHVSSHFALEYTISSRARALVVLSTSDYHLAQFLPSMVPLSLWSWAVGVALADPMHFLPELHSRQVDGAVSGNVFLRREHITLVSRHTHTHFHLISHQLIGWHSCSAQMAKPISMVVNSHTLAAME